MKPNQQLLVMMLGVPGSGKSYFARGLAEHLDMKRITADKVRTRLFGSINAGRTPENHRRTYEMVNQEMEVALRNGESVVRDNQNNHRSDRDMCRAIAQEVGAKVVIVWMQTPREVAVQRCTERPDAPDQIRLNEQTANEFYDSSIQAMETPTAEEDCLRIDGTLEFFDQLSMFETHIHNNQAK